MSILQEMHQAHRARLMRLGAIPKPEPIAPPLQHPVKPPPEPIAPTAAKNELIAIVIEDHVCPVIPYSLIDTIQKVIAIDYDITQDELMSNAKRKYIYAWPRHVAIYLAKRLTNYSNSRIGRYFKQRDHTTIYNAIRNVADARRYDAKINARLAELEARFRAAIQKDFPCPLCHGGKMQWTKEPWSP